MSDHYTPIDCGLHSQYELHVMHRDLLRLGWRDEAGGEHFEVVRPRDLRTASGGEYLVCERGDGTEMALRLDRIIRSERASGGSR